MCKPGSPSKADELLLQPARLGILRVVQEAQKQGHLSQLKALQCVLQLNRLLRCRCRRWAAAGRPLPRSLARRLPVLQARRRCKVRSSNRCLLLTCGQPADALLHSLRIDRFAAVAAAGFGPHGEQ